MELDELRAEEEVKYLAAPGVVAYSRIE